MLAGPFPKRKHQCSTTHAVAEGRPISLFLPSGKLFGGTPRSDKARTQSEKLGLDCAHDDANPALMLNYAAQANWIGLVLFFLQELGYE